MKILIFTPTVGRGGVSLVVRKVLRGLADYAPSDWEFSVLGQSFNETGIPVSYPTEWAFTQIDPVERLPAHPEQFRFLWMHTRDFYNHLKRIASEFELIYCPSAWWVIGSKDWDLPCPFVTHVPDFAFDFINMGQLLELHFRYASQKIQERADSTIFPSEFYRRHAISTYAFDETKTAVIPHSADFVVDNYSPTTQEALRVREKYGLPDNYLLSFHCLYHKDPFTILRAQKYARSHSPLVPPLVLAGIDTQHLLSEKPPDGHTEQVQRTIQEIGAHVGEDLFILGHIPDEDIAGLYAAATASISASRMEGDLSGNTFNSFMAHCPHIYSDIPVYTMRIGRERFGYSFTAGEFVDLAQRLIDVCADRDEARRRAVAAYGYAVSRTVKDVANEYIDVFKKVMER